MLMPMAESTLFLLFVIWDAGIATNTNFLLDF
jgi:hypothetical protein